MMACTLKPTSPYIREEYACAYRDCIEPAEYYLHIKKDRGRATNHRRCAKHARKDAVRFGIEFKEITK
jgi:hypothetical protein